MAGLGCDELDELGLERVHWLTGLLVHVDVEESSERVFTAQAVLEGGFEGFGVGAFERNCTDTGSCVSDAGIPDPAEVAGDALHDGGGAGLFFDGGFEVSAFESDILEEAVGSGGAVTSEDRDGFRCPGTGEP